MVENESYLANDLLRSAAGESDTYSYIQHAVEGSSLVLQICPKFKDSSSQNDVLSWSIACERYTLYSWSCGVPD